MERETIKLEKVKAREVIAGDDPDFEVVEDTLYGTNRWSELYRVTVRRKSDKKLFQTEYSVGATEMQDERPFENTEPVFKQVYGVKKIVVVYE